MSSPDPAVLALLARMLEAGQNNVTSLVGAVERVTRELSSLSFNYNSHLIRAGMRSAALQALDGQLDEASALLGRTLFTLQQQVLNDEMALRRLTRVYDIIDLEDERPPIERLRDGLDRYCHALESDLRRMSETLDGLGVRLRLMANNVEIAAAHTGGTDVHAPVELFVIMANQLRGLANRLRNATGDLRIFEQTQNGHAESLRVALASPEKGAAA